MAGFSANPCRSIGAASCLGTPRSGPYFYSQLFQGSAQAMGEDGWINSPFLSPQTQGPRESSLMDVCLTLNLPGRRHQLSPRDLAGAALLL